MQPKKSQLEVYEVTETNSNQVLQIRDCIYSGGHRTPFGTGIQNNHNLYSRTSIRNRKSERIRSKANHEYPKRLLIEGFKWGATLILWLRYTATLQFAKANMLVRFRYWVSQGLLQRDRL